MSVTSLRKERDQWKQCAESLSDASKSILSGFDCSHVELLRARSKDSSAGEITSGNVVALADALTTFKRLSQKETL
jgi:hypothetical protein